MEYIPNVSVLFGKKSEVDDTMMTLAETEKILCKFPDRIPVFLTRKGNCHLIPELPKKKYLVPYEMNLGQFIYFILRLMNLDGSVALFVFVNGYIPSVTQSIRTLYEEEKSKTTGMLHITYHGENTFG